MRAAVNKSFEQIDRSITVWMAEHGLLLLRLSVGLVFLWFGFLKFFPGLSPAQNLAVQTIDILSFGFLSPSVSIIILAAWEVSIGVGLLFGFFMRGTLLLLFLQMIGTMTPLFLFPDEAFSHFPYAPTLEGQYIIKNLVLITAGIVLGACVRGGKIVANAENSPR